MKEKEKEKKTKKTDNKKPHIKLKIDRTKLMWVVALALVYVVTLTAVLLAVAQPARSVNVGDTLTEDLIAPRDLYDDDMTVAKRLQASASVEKVYVADEEIYSSLTNGAMTFFDALDRVRVDANSVRRQKAAVVDGDAPEITLQTTGMLTADQWREVLTEDDIAVIRTSDVEPLSDDDIYGLLSVSESDMTSWMYKAQMKINQVLRKGVKDSDLQDIRAKFRNELEPDTPIAIRPLCAVLSREFINPTLIYSETDTFNAMEEAANNVEDQYIERGDVIAEAGTVVTEELYEELLNANIIRQTGGELLMLALVALMLAVILAGLVGLIVVYLPRYLSDSVKAMLAAILIAVVVAVALFSLGSQYVFNPIYLLIIFLTLLVSGRVSAIAVIYISVVFGMMAMGSSHDYSMFARVAVTTAAGGMAGILAVRKAARRSATFTGSFLASFAMIVVNSAFCVMDSAATSDILMDALKLLGSNMVCAVIGIGVMPFWEWLFKVATPQKLAELANADHPLLKRLIIEAPGTYHHSMLVSTLSEAAAEAVGANALLARVGAFYHDVGKLKRPVYFAENQRPGENPHDALEPEKSAAVLTAHVKDGVLMLQKAKMPADIIKFAQEHHGTSVTSFFYYKATKLYEDPNLPKGPYRYPGPRPSTRETAIVMICDSCEAAVRSLTSPTQEQVQEMVQKIIRGKIDEGQLAKCPLTLADLAKIEASILSTFKGILHERIEYPDLSDLKNEPVDEQ